MSDIIERPKKLPFSKSHTTDTSVLIRKDVRIPDDETLVRNGVRVVADDKVKVDGEDYYIFNTTEKDHVGVYTMDKGHTSILLNDYIEVINRDDKLGKHPGVVRAMFSNPETYHTFVPNENLMDLMLLTDNNNLRARPIPFDIMYIPLKYVYKGIVFNGMFAYVTKTTFEDKMEIRHYPNMNLKTGWIITLSTLMEESYYDGDSRIRGHRWVFPQVFDEDGRQISDNILRPKGFGIRQWSEASKALANLFFNLVDFLNHPEVEYKVHSHDEKEQLSRVRRGKPRMSPNILIKVTGKTARYLDAMKSIGKREFAHAFWVRGHYRHLVSDFYKDMKGKNIWVPPFIKGDKELIKKVYEMKWPPLKEG